MYYSAVWFPRASITEFDLFYYLIYFWMLRFWPVSLFLVCWGVRIGLAFCGLFEFLLGVRGWFNALAVCLVAEKVFRS